MELGNIVVVAEFFFENVKYCIKLTIACRYDYIDRMTESDLPSFKKFLKDGTSAEYVQTIFPSMSYPSWASIVTGYSLNA